MRLALPARLFVLPFLLPAPLPHAHNRPVIPLSPQVASSRPDWESPAVFERGKEPARATAFPYETHELALEGDHNTSRQSAALART